MSWIYIRASLALHFAQTYICEVGDLKKDKNVLFIAGINRAELPMCLYSMPLWCTYSPPYKAVLLCRLKNTFYLQLKSHFRSRIIHAFHGELLSTEEEERDVQ